MEEAEQEKMCPTGTYESVEHEKTIMQMTTDYPRVVVHFAHRDFKRCRIMDAHLNSLAKQYPSTKFFKIFVENANFLVEKLKIKVLPCVICFKDAVTVDK